MEQQAKARIYNLIIVDESGSMSSLRESTLSGINETINTIKSAQEEFKETQEHFLTLVTFDSGGSSRKDVRTLIDTMPIDKVGVFKDYDPNGCTPLYDAMGQSISRLRKQIKGDPDASAVVTVLTDGLENSSREWNASRVRLLIMQLKEEGWTFSYMGSAHDVKEVTDLLGIDNMVEFSHDVGGSSSTWARERAAKRQYYYLMNNMYEEEASLEQRMRRRREYAERYYSPRVTPDYVDELEPNEVFVFGSNLEGRHRGGAAALAVRKFGAIKGQAEGLQGQSYAIPTVVEYPVFVAAVKRFIKFAENHPDMRFLVTRVGCGSAGYSPEIVAPMFEDCIKLENVSLPSDFWTILGLNME